jgi:hypothetical protein
VLVENEFHCKQLLIEMSTNSRYPKRTRGIANTGNDHARMAAANNVDNDPTTSSASAAASRSAFVSSIYSYATLSSRGDPSQ